ncbi:MAG: VOC family protein [Actinobacteria bacterium]|nr:VOC family protein [Actinomycetota bacterium]
MSLKGIHHIGILVDDLQQAEAFLGDALGLSVVKRASIPDEKTEVCFFDCGGVSLELIAIDDPELRARRGRSGGAAPEIEHVALAVDDIADDADRLRGHGVRFAATGALREEADAPLELSGSKSYFSFRDTSVGIVWQLIEEAA